MRKSRKPFRERRLDEKLQIVFTFLFAAVLALTLLIFLFSSYDAAKKQAESLAESQLHAAEKNYRDWFQKVQDTAISVIISSDIQKFCKDPKLADNSYYTLRTEISDTLNTTLHMNQDIQYMLVLNDKNLKFVDRGVFSARSFATFDMMRRVNENGVRASDRSSLYILHGSDYLGRHEEAFVAYHPIFSTTKIFKRNGTLYFYLDDRIFVESGNNEEYLADNILLTDLCGNVLVSSRPLTEYTPLDYSDQDNGVVYNHGSLFYYTRLSGWNFYVICEIAMWKMMESSLWLSVMILVFSVLLFLILLLVIRHIIRKNYEPLKNVMDAMAHTERGELDYRITSLDEGEDVRVLEDGYNNMMDTIGGLMDKVRAEQHQAEQIKLNALQSQIQPHFLYNTLDCIHWQALADGSVKTSELVHELADYYRICLSKGREIITLSQELEHIGLYLSIQKKRYGDIISYEMDVPENLMEIHIPKLSLQPLVENSIYHGIRVKEGLKGTVYIKAWETEDCFMISESDNGLGMSEADIEEMNASISDYSRDFGYGVRNVNRRIELYYGKNYGLKYFGNAEGGVTAVITLPKHYEKEKDLYFGEEDV